MSELRPFALLRTGDQWIRCSFDKTFLDLDAGIVELEWSTSTNDSSQPAPTLAAGLAFDQECRLYHSLPSEGRVERILWKATDPLGPVTDQPSPVNLIEGERTERLGDFTVTDHAGPLLGPGGVAVDINDRLFITETGRDRILIYDLWSERLIRKITMSGACPTDLAAHGIDVYAVLSGTKQIVRLDARSDPVPFDIPTGCTDPTRIAVSPGGRVAILDKAGTPGAHVWFTTKGYTDFAVSSATDVEWESEAVIVVARQPGADFLRYEIAPDERAQLASLRARGYDGLGIVATPELIDSSSASHSVSTAHRIGYWTASGFRTAVPARLIYERVGRLTTFRFDSGSYQTVWGRLFIDACVPEGADLRAHYIVLDEAEDETPLPRVPPKNVHQVTIKRPDLSPPMPPEELKPGPTEVSQRVHRRESGRELPWTQPAAEDHFKTYEAPINAPAGRFLWVTLELRGNTRVSPKIRCIRAEYPAHDYLRRLPKTFSRDAQGASFLLRYLALFEGFLGETEARGVDRDLLLDPRSAPDECIPWLASFIGLTLDERWAKAPSPNGQTAIDARREMIREAVWLFRYRGTLPGLKRFIELYTGIPVIIIEHYRMRGIGASVLGDTGAAFSSSIVGVGFRIGGAVGSETVMPIQGNVEDAFRTHAHRFTAIIPAALTAEQLDVVRNIIEVHRPAHTIFDVCTVSAGMRVGRGLIVEISSVIGRTGGFSTFQVGNAVLGRGAIIGRPEEGSTLGSGRLGTDMRVG
jgi:phage tail-like protein